VGANWYPRARLNLGAQYYHKIRDYDYDILRIHTANAPPSGNRYPAFLGSKIRNRDMNIRATWRPLTSLTLITRYDFQLSTIDTRGDFLNNVQSAEITSHIIGESISWAPLPRLYLQASASYALDSTDTPATGLLGTTISSSGANDYWNATATWDTPQRQDGFAGAILLPIGRTTTSTTRRQSALWGGRRRTWV